MRGHLNYEQIFAKRGQAPVDLGGRKTPSGMGNYPVGNGITGYGGQFWECAYRCKLSPDVTEQSSNVMQFGGLRKVAPSAESVKRL